jgi:putative DNA primase/helicase
VTYRMEPRRGKEKLAKVPYSVTTGRRANPTDPMTWGTYQQADQAAKTHQHDGVGFVFSEEDPLTGLDFDDCRNPETGEIHPSVLEELKRLGNPYTEISPSGTGLKSFIKAKKPGDPCTISKTPWGGKLEIYDRNRFFTITGDVLIHAPVQEAQKPLEALYRRFWPKPVGKQGQSAAVPSTVPTRDPTDKELLERARRAEYGRKFAALYDEGNLSVSGNDHSRADNDLMVQLAYWCGKAPERMERLFSESALGQRKKWRCRPDYRRRTIDHAIRRTGKVYTPENHQPRKTKTRDRLEEYIGYAVLAHPWAKLAGRADAGATDYSLYRAMVGMAYRANSDEIAASERDLTVKAGLGKRNTTRRGLARLEDTHGLVEKVADGGYGKAARYRIKSIPKRGQTKIWGDYLKEEVLPPNCVYNEIGPVLGSQMVRNTSPITEKEYDKNGRKIIQSSAEPVTSVGKVAAWVLDVIHAAKALFAPNPVPIEFLAQRTGMAPNHLRERPLKKLLEADLIEQVEGGYQDPEDVQLKLARELRDSGSTRKSQRQREQFEEQRRIHHVHRLAAAGVDFDGISYRTGFSVAEIIDILKLPDRAPTPREMDEARWSRLKPSGRLSELERESPVFRGVFVGAHDGQCPIEPPSGEVGAREPGPRSGTPSSAGRTATLPPKVDGVYEHGPECACVVRGSCVIT